MPGANNSIMDILIIGGTRNLGTFMVPAFLSRGYSVSVLNRGLTRDDLPDAVERLRADRNDPDDLRKALGGRSFDVVIDNALYKQPEAEAVVDILNGKVGQFIFLSSGQVYLVREGVERPFHENDYAGRLMPAPKINTFGFEEWLYGVDKRRVEDTLFEAHTRDGFPATSLRLPMVSSERDHYNRTYAYILRLQDGGPILVPTTPNFRLRHIYGEDVVAACLRLIDTGVGKGSAYNISQEETVTLDEYLHLLAKLMGLETPPAIVRMRRDLLEANGFLPDCSPFSERWMSELDNTLSKTELGMNYTPLAEYLARIVRYYQETAPPPPAGYRRRRAELLLVEQEGANAVS
ncbi:MAG: NAD-dependent epimerase/dehydratase family protein [Anaerolineae bacterium]|nr:NAD-dependent epimerase/dehydratase family protein [Anaerolineae bacterium]